jgi:DNA polymerase elongation subunit (family B)
MKVHIFDAISRDQRVIRATEDEIELEYINTNDSDSDDDWRKKKQSLGNTQGREMVIHLFGMTAEGESVRVDVTGFRPFFYVAVPPEVDWQSISKKLSTKIKQEFNQIDFKLEHKQKLYGYSGNKKCAFVRISMPSLGMFYTVRKEFLDEKQNPKFVLNARGKPLEVFETNIDPMLRFFHMRDIKPCGWVEVDGDETEAEEGISLRCKWQNVSPAESSVVTAPLLHAFWDIECYSHTGEFPQANPEKKVCLSSPQPCRNCSHCFLNAQGDPIIQIGTTLWSPACGDKPEFTERHIFVLAENSGKTRSGCAAVPNARVYVCKKEVDLLISWFQFIVERKVNVFVGYNIFGFDEKYVWQRLERLSCDQNEEVQQFSHLFNEGKPMKLIEKRLSSSALGDNMLYMWDTPGRLRIDLLGHIKRKAQLPSYKLDSVAAVYLSGKLSGVSPLSKGPGPDAKGKWLIKTKDKKDARVGRYVQLLDDLGEDLTDKMEIMEVVPEGFVVRSEECLTAIAGAAARWAVVKDDVSPQDIFRLHRGSDEDRAKVAAYCVQDCDLTLELYKKLDVFNEAMSMANVCSVPVSYIFTRGQGIKIESLIFKDCMKTGQLIKVFPSADSNADSYEGAIVLDPTPGFYTDSPVGVCDFASLYPSTIISENISHDMLVWAKDYDLQGRLVCVSYGAVEDEANAIPGTQWTDIEFDIMRPDPEDGRKHPTKLKAGTRHCRYAQPPGDKKGSLPQIVAKLLAARKAKRVEITKTDDPFKKALLDAEQNAYKITANSLYGQLGSPTFKIRLQNLAASVTAYGRKQIMFSKEAIERFYGPEAGDPRCDAKIVYGDTDSIFVSFTPKDSKGTPLTGREAIVATQELTEEVGKFITGALKAPHDFEYDKTFSPFIIFSKKRYVGNKYEESPDDFKETSMGIVLKRRDNAPLLKMTYGSAIDRLLNHRDVVGAVEVVKKNVMELVQGKMKLSQLTITKSLRSEYKCTPPAHKILAQRIAARDPGNAPASGERIGYVYVQAMPGQEASKLQGDRVETPEFIVANGLKPDAEYYILHQLYNPLAQLFGLMVEKMPGFVAPVWAKDADKLIGQREALAGELLFQEGLTACKNLAKRDFVGKFFGLRPEGPLGQRPTGVQSENLLSESPIAQKPQGRRTPPADPTLAAAEAAAFGSGSGSAAKVPTFKQPALQFTPFQKDIAVWVDDMIVKKMRSKPKKKETTN